MSKWMTVAYRGAYRRAQGFSLIELMITLAIIAILASLAYPSYQEHVAQGRRGEAMAALMEGAQALERYYSANGRYLNGGNVAAVFPAQVPATGAARYTIATTIATADTFTLRATRVGIMAGDDCGDFEITHAGARQLNGATRPVDECWRR